MVLSGFTGMVEVEVEVKLGRDQMKWLQCVTCHFTCWASLCYSVCLTICSRILRCATFYKKVSSHYYDLWFRADSSQSPSGPAEGHGLESDPQLSAASRPLPLSLTFQSFHNKSSWSFPSPKNSPNNQGPMHLLVLSEETHCIRWK